MRAARGCWQGTNVKLVLAKGLRPLVLECDREGNREGKTKMKS